MNRMMQANATAVADFQYDRKSFEITSAIDFLVFCSAGNLKENYGPARG